jgi:hypothetical protein
MEAAWYQQQQAARARVWGGEAKMWDGSNPFIPGGGNTVWDSDGLLVADSQLRWASGIGRVDKDWTDAIQATAQKSTSVAVTSWQQLLPKNRAPWPV